MYVCVCKNDTCSPKSDNPITQAQFFLTFLKNSKSKGEKMSVWLDLSINTFVAIYAC